MAIRIKGAKIESIEDTETKRLRVIKINSKPEGLILTLEVPEALCTKIEGKRTLDLVIDSKPIVGGEKALLYMEGKVFKKSDEKEFEAVATMGGLRLVVTLKQITPAKKKTFDMETIFLTLT